MSRQADPDRAAAYAAEDAALLGTLVGDHLGALVGQLGEAVQASAWWGSCTSVRLDVRPTRDGGGSASYARASGVVALHSEQHTAAVLAHEVGHVLARQYGVTTSHGPLWRVAFVDVLELVGGTAVAEQLAGAFVRWQLPPAGRRWPAPPGSGSGLLGALQAGRLNATAGGAVRAAGGAIPLGPGG